MTELAQAPSSVLGWRVFAVENGRLVAPIWNICRPGVSDRLHWTPGINRAECLDRAGCVAPAVDCTCGYRAVENLYYLHEWGRRPTPAGKTILGESGVIARVRLSGRLLPGYDIPADDPETTWRGGQAEIVELHIGPDFEHLATGLKISYGVPVAVYEPDEWPQAVSPLDPMGPRREISEDDFRVALSELSFGSAGSFGEVFALAEKRPEAGNVIAYFVKIGRDCAQAMVDDIPAPDIARTLWDNAMKPSMAETTAFTDAVIEHLYPYHPDMVRRVQLFTTPPTLMATMERDINSAIDDALSPLKRSAG